MAPMANAVIVNVEVGDQPYYIHGPGYYVGRVYWVWIPGIGNGVTITESGSTAITLRAKGAHFST
jgi:hypothetical protein